MHLGTHTSKATKAGQKMDNSKIIHLPSIQAHEMILGMHIPIK